MSVVIFFSDLCLMISILLRSYFIYQGNRKSSYSYELNKSVNPSNLDNLTTLSMIKNMGF